MDLTESQFSGCDGSSNFIPSSESDPPPPVSYRVAEYKPGDIHINGSEVNTQIASPALDMSVYSSFEASDFETKPGSFTQADDFQDLLKENEDPSKLKVDQSSSVDCAHGFQYSCLNRGGKSLGHITQDLFDEVPNQNFMRLSEPLSTQHKITTNSTNSPFLSGLVSHSSSLTRLPNSASVLLNSSAGDDDEEDISGINDHEISYNHDESDHIGENEGSSSIMTLSKKPVKKQNLVKNDSRHSTDSILAINVSAIVYQMDNTHNVIFDSRFNVKINNVNIEAAYHRLQKDNAKLIAELSCLLKPTGGCSGTKQVKTSDSLSSISPPITDSSSHVHAASSKSNFPSSSMSTSNSDFAQPKLDENPGSTDNHSFPFKSPVRASSSGSELFIPRSKNNKSNVRQLPKKKSPIRVSTTSSSSSDLFIPRPANKFGSLNSSASVHSSMVMKPTVNQSISSLLVSEKEPFGGNDPRRESVTLVSETVSEDTGNELAVAERSEVNDEVTYVITDSETNSPGNNDKKEAMTTTTVVSDPRDETLTPNKTTSDEQWVYAKWKFEGNYYAGKAYSSKNSLRFLVHFEDQTKASVKESDIVQVYLLPVGAEVSAQIRDDYEYWSNCVIQAHLDDSARPYEILCRTTNKVYRLQRRQVSINEVEVKNLRFRKLLPSSSSSHVDPPVSPHNDSNVCDTNSVLKKCASPDVSLANIISEKRKCKPKTYRSSWITPKRFATPVDGDDVCHSDDARHAETVPSKTVPSTSARKDFRKQLHHQPSSSWLSRDSRSRSSSSTPVESKVPTTHNSAKKQRLSDLFSDDDECEDLTQPMFKETPVAKID
uniref:Tumour suppressor p53-binding protein-1 Tudor domain-containing protein n=1 Tax=Trichobilharzia regenti TaxID=157069 RepID=A0AA85JNM3_TRIRE|nr:unnamed protein product [Trichobilharzia regenti]